MEVPHFEYVRRSRTYSKCELLLNFRIGFSVYHGLGRQRKELGMSYTLHVEPRNTYLYITVTGENSLDTVSHYLAEIHDWCLLHDCPNVLLVENLSGPGLRTSSIYELVSAKSAQAARVVGRMAYVDINPAHDLEEMKFAENVAVNRGITVRVFATVQEAQAWLERPE
jgi:hypothetical protein